MDAEVLPNGFCQTKRYPNRATQRPFRGQLGQFPGPFCRQSGDLFGTAQATASKSISSPKCLLSESLRKGDGVGPVVALDEHCCKLLVVTLGITDVVERTGLTVSVWGSRIKPNGAPSPAHFSPASILRCLLGSAEYGDAPRRALLARPVEHEPLGKR